MLIKAETLICSGLKQKWVVAYPICSITIEICLKIFHFFFYHYVSYKNLDAFLDINEIVSDLDFKNQQLYVVALRKLN